MGLRIDSCRDRLDINWSEGYNTLFIRTSKFKFRLTVLNFFENLRLDCS